MAERSAVISMKSARILGMLRGPGVRFERISDRGSRVIWQPSYDERILAQARAPEFPDRDANAIFRQMDFYVATGRVGRDRTKPWAAVRPSDIVYETGGAWVARMPDSYTVFRTGATHSTSDSAYPRDVDGLSIAKARADYLSRNSRGHSRRKGRTSSRAARRAGKR